MPHTAGSPYCGPTFANRRLYGTHGTSDADVDLFRALSRITYWQNATSAKSAIAGVASTLHEFGMDGYCAPPFPQLRLADFIRAVLAVPGGYERVLLRNEDGSMTLFRAKGARCPGRLQRTVDYCHCIDGKVGDWNRLTFAEKYFTSSRDLDKVERRMFYANRGYFRGDIDFPETGSSVSVRPCDEGYGRAERTLIINLADQQPETGQDTSRPGSAQSDDAISMSDPINVARLARLRSL